MGKVCMLSDYVAKKKEKNLNTSFYDEMSYLDQELKYCINGGYDLYIQKDNDKFFDIIKKYYNLNENEKNSLSENQNKAIVLVNEMVSLFYYYTDIENCWCKMSIQDNIQEKYREFTEIFN